MDFTSRSTTIPLSAAYVPGFHSNIFDIVNREALKIASLKFYPEGAGWVGVGWWVEYQILKIVLHKNLVFNCKGSLPHLKS